MDNHAQDAPRTDASSNIIDLSDKLTSRERLTYLSSMQRVARTAVTEIERTIADSELDPLDCAAFILAMLVKQRAFSEEVPIWVVLDAVMPMVGHYMTIDRAGGAGA